MRNLHGQFIHPEIKAPILEWVHKKTQDWSQNQKSYKKHWCVYVCLCTHVCAHFLQVERFWLQSDAAVCVLAGLGLSRTHTELERRLGLGGVWKTTGWVLTMALLAHMVHTNHR